VTGADRLRWLNGQITNDVKELEIGAGKPAAVLDVKGHILADLVVYGLAGSVWIDLSRDRAQAVRDALDRYIVADDVVVENGSDQYGHLLVVGCRASDLIARTLGEDAANLRPWHHTEVWLGDVQVRILASRRLGMPGYDMIFPAGVAGRVWERLLALGGDWGLRPVGMAALNLLRVEAGWPWYGVDFDGGNLLTESLSRDHISFTKGCYLGQEVVIRVEHQGHLNRRLSGLLVSGEAVPPAGALILSGERKVGTVTSAVRSPGLKRVIALGYVRRECWEPGTTLGIAWDQQFRDAEVALLPFIPFAEP